MEIVGIAIHDVKAGEFVQIALDGTISNIQKEEKRSLILPKWNYQNDYKIPTLDLY